jgi:hypothetical protein
MIMMLMMILFNQIVNNTGVTKIFIHTDQRWRYKSKKINDKKINTEKIIYTRL